MKSYENDKNDLKTTRESIKGCEKSKSNEIMKNNVSRRIMKIVKKNF